jgi:Gluconate 2-dehydrogenase subunit 3
MNRRDYIKNTALIIGYAISAGALSEAFVACKSERELKLDWQPSFLTKPQAQTLAEMAETILPKTSTPGAKDIGVAQYIDKVLKDLLSETEQKDFVKGLEVLEDICKSNYGRYFEECTLEQKEQILLKMDRDAAKFPPTMWGIVLVENPDPVTFYRRLKALTLTAYFTSEKIGKDVLSYNPIPGVFIGCMPYTGQNVWSGE